MLNWGSSISHSHHSWQDRHEEVSYFQVTSSPGFSSLKRMTIKRLMLWNVIIFHDHNSWSIKYNYYRYFSFKRWSLYLSYLLYKALLFLNAVSFLSCCLSRYHPTTKPMGTKIFTQCSRASATKLTMIPVGNKPYCFDYFWLYILNHMTPVTLHCSPPPLFLRALVTCSSTYSGHTQTHWDKNQRANLTIIYDIIYDDEGSGQNTITLSSFVL